MSPRAYKYGIKYFFNQDFRRIVKNKERNLKSRATYKSFNGNRKSLKIALFRLNGNKCFWCNNKMTFQEATIDHIKPASQGGSNKKDNLRLIHNDCRVERDRLIQRGVLGLVN